MLHEPYTALSEVHVTQRQNALNWVVLNCSVPVNFFQVGSQLFFLEPPENDSNLNHYCRARSSASFPSISLKFGVFTGEKKPQFPCKSWLSVAFMTPTCRTLRLRQFEPSEAKYFQLFKRSQSGFNNVFWPNNYTTGFGKDKEKDCGAFDGISSVKIAEKMMDSEFRSFLLKSNVKKSHFRVWNRRRNLRGCCCGNIAQASERRRRKSLQRSPWKRIHFIKL
ncbi:uncharacterized protein [Montipora capricornis]|uniref:uncharacterized protein n=1 Tax=Montipora capricornis TaxID=246305 RepID=UPI0035F1CCA9